jgi:hypothetical protein
MHIVVLDRNDRCPAGKIAGRLRNPDSVGEQFPEGSSQRLLNLSLAVDTSKVRARGFDIIAGYVPDDAGLSFWLARNGQPEARGLEHIGYCEHLRESVWDDRPIAEHRAPFLTAVRVTIDIARDQAAIQTDAELGKLAALCADANYKLETSNPEVDKTLGDLMSAFGRRCRLQAVSDALRT